MGRDTPRGEPTAVKEMQGYKPPERANPGNMIQESIEEAAMSSLLRASEVVSCKVGGGLMGSKHAHGNGAPFALSLASFFVKTFCPPGGVVLDPMCGSSTTGHATLLADRRYIGIDVRQRQINLSRQRLEDIAKTAIISHGRPAADDISTTSDGGDDD